MCGSFLWFLDAEPMGRPNGKLHGRSALGRLAKVQVMHANVCVPLRAW